MRLHPSLLKFFLLALIFTFTSHLFLFTDTATTEIYTLSLHDDLPIFDLGLRAEEPCRRDPRPSRRARASRDGRGSLLDRKSTRLNSSHPSISYAVFCLKKKNT